MRFNRGQINQNKVGSNATRAIDFISEVRIYLRSNLDAPFVRCEKKIKNFPKAENGRTNIPLLDLSALPQVKIIFHGIGIYFGWESEGHLAWAKWQNCWRWFRQLIPADLDFSHLK